MKKYSLAKLLLEAEKKGYAVPAINVFNYESIKWAMEAANEEHMPIILQYVPKFEKYISANEVASIISHIKKEIRVPVLFHLDHAHTKDEVEHNIKNFDSVMIDGSGKSYEENVMLTTKIVEFSHKYNVEVEAEMGLIGSTQNESDYLDNTKYTDPDEAIKFIDATECDCFAMAIGNAHGIYKECPKLDFSRLAEIRRRVNIPLVLHGGSGLNETQLAEAIENGISKVNIFTDYNKAFYNNVKQQMYKTEKGFFLGSLRRAREEVTMTLREKIRLLNPNHIDTSY